jgi:hypothetical protein
VGLLDALAGRTPAERFGSQGRSRALRFDTEDLFDVLEDDPDSALAVARSIAREVGRGAARS